MPWRILIVDDHAIVRRMLKVLVETHPGWEVCAEADNGQEALAKLREQKPDLIIMDMAMPVKDGLSASREISASMPNIPIVMHTLHYSPELELEAKKSGVRKIVPKAESGDGLLKTIAELLDESSSHLSKGARAIGNSSAISALRSPEQNDNAGDDAANHNTKN